MKNRVTISQLEAFDATVRLGSVTMASRALNVTQPAISLSIKQLEKSLDAALLEMVNKRLNPTSTGRVVYEAGREILDKLNDLVLGVLDSGQNFRGDLTIAMVSTAKFFIPKILGEFLKLHPGVNPTLYILNRQDVIQMLKDNRCDFAIMSQVPVVASLKKESFCENPLVMISAPTKKLLKQTQIQVSQLKDEHLIVREKGSGIRSSIESLFLREKVPMNIRMELSSTEAIKQVVAARLGVGLVPLMSIQQELKNKSLMVLPVENTPISQNWHFVVGNGKRLSKLALAFKAYVDAHIDKYLNE